MRAFLSVPHDQDFDTYRGLAGHLAGSQSAAAVNEAHGILAHAEPNQTERLLVASVIGQHFTPADGWRYMADVWTGSAEDGNAHAALAEALAAFVGPEIAHECQCDQHDCQTMLPSDVAVCGPCVTGTCCLIEVRQ